MYLWPLVAAEGMEYWSRLTVNFIYIRRFTRWAVNREIYFFPRLGETDYTLRLYFKKNLKKFPLFQPLCVHGIFLHYFPRLQKIFRNLFAYLTSQNNPNINMIMCLHHPSPLCPYRAAQNLYLLPHSRPFCINIISHAVPFLVLKIGFKVWASGFFYGSSPLYGNWKNIE